MDYWTQDTPPSIDPDRDLLLYLCYYPLKIVAAEWINYTGVMDRTIKKYEYSNKDFSQFHLALDKLDSDMKDLQTWRRRVVRSQQKIKVVSEFLQKFDTNEARDLWEDFQYISAMITECGRLLETTIPLVTSFVQVIDSRRAFVEATNVTRLTTLALVFVPLSFISSLFSMKDVNAPGGDLFWVYFAVAVPVTLVVYLIARPPGKDTLRSIRSTIFAWSKKNEVEKNASRAATPAKTKV